MVDYSAFDTSNPTTLKISGALTVSTASGIAKLESAGLYLDGAATFQLNTTGQQQTVYLPSPSDPHNPDAATAFVISAQRFSISPIAGTTPSTFANIDYQVNGFDTFFTMSGDFDLRITATGASMFANINSLVVGPSSTPIITFQGYGLFVINNDGIAAVMTLNLNSGTTASFGGGLTLDATFVLVMNTTSKDVTYVVPSNLPPVTIPGTSTMVTTLTVPRGPPQGLLQSDGTFAGTGAAGPYIVITGTGTLGISLGSLDALSFTGFFRFELSSGPSGPLVSLVIDMTGDVGTFANISITGALQIDNSGVVALLDLGVGGGTSTDYGDGVVLTATFQLAINSTGANVNTIGGIALKDSAGDTLTIPQSTYQIVGSGTLALSIGGTGFLVTGSIFTSISGTKTTITVSGILTATVAGAKLLTMNANGVLVVETGGSNPGIAGELTLSETAGSPLDGTGFFFSGSFDLQLNTTTVSQVVTVGSGTTTIAAGLDGSSTPADYIEVHANGTLYFGTTDNDFYLTGDFYLAISTDGFAVSTNVSLGIKIGGTSLFSTQVTGAFMIASDGIALELSVSSGVNFNGPSSNGSSFGFSMGGTFTLTVNTTGRVVSIGSVNIAAAANGLPAGPYFVVSVPDAFIILGNSSTGFDLECNFTLTISSQGLAISGSGNLALNVGGTTLFSFHADGALLINSQGIAAEMNLTISTGGSRNQFVFSANVEFTLEINTTSVAISKINDQEVDLPAGPYFRVAGSGSLTLASIVNISASFELTVTATEVNMQLSGVASSLGVTFTLKFGMGIYDDGIEINATLGLTTGGSTASFLNGIVQIDARFQLEINNSPTHSNHGVPVGQTFLLDVTGGGGDGTDATVYVLGFKLTGQLKILISNGQFSATGTINFNFFGFTGFDVDFYFDSTGKYWFYGHTGVTLGSSDFNIHGDLDLMFASQSVVNANSTVNANNIYDNFGGKHLLIDHTFLLHVGGGVTAFGFNFASIGADVEINGTSVDISVYVSVDFGLFSIGGTVHIHLGSLANIPPPPPPALGRVQNVGGINVLYLNLGLDADNFRNVPSLPDESYQIYNAGGGNIWVAAPGVYSGDPKLPDGTVITGAPQGVVQYNNVQQIVVTNSGSSNTSIFIASDVTQSVNIHLGKGTNQISLGGGLATVYGSTGKDTIIGGTGGVIFHAGTGTSTFIGGRGNNVVYDPALVNIVQGYQTIDSSNNPLFYYFNTYSLTDAAAGSGYTYTLTYSDSGGSYTTNLVGTNFTVKLTTPSTGTASFTVANFSGLVTLNGNGNPNATASVTLDANLTLNGNVITGSNGGVVTLQSVPSLQLYGGASANTFTINSWSGTSPLLLDGMGGDDTYKINFVGSGNYTVNVNDSGATGTDSLIVNGTNNADTLTVTSNSITRASESVNYTGVENITLNTFGGNDTVNVTSPSAAIVINGGNGTDIFNINSLTNALTINTGTGVNTLNVPTMNSIQAVLSVNGGGTDTLNLNDTADNTPNSGILGSTSLTGFFGVGGSMNYSGIETMNLNLGNGGNTLTIFGRSGVTNISTGSGSDTINVLAVGGTTNINAGAGPNTFNIGSLVFNNGTGVLDGVQGTINYTGSGNDVMNVDDSGSDTPDTGTLRADSLTFFDPVVINFTGVTSINISLSQSGDVFAVVDTITSSSTTPVVLLYTNGGDDIITIIDTHAVMTVNAGDGDDNIYVFGNSSVLNLNGDDGDDTFYIFASLHENTSNVDPGNSGPAGNTIYSYRNNGAVNIDGGAGHDRVFIFGTVLNDIITIDGNKVTGAGVDVTFTNIEELIVSGLGGDDVFYVLNVTVPTTLVGDGTLPSLPIVPPDVTLPDLTGGAVATSFNDTFYIGWMGQSYIPGHLSTILAPLTIEGDDGIDTAYVDDSGATANTSFILNSTSLWSSSMGANGIINYDSTVDNLNIKAGAGDDTITINGNATGSQTTINGGAGNDHFIINDDPLQAPLAIVGDSNTFQGDTLTLNGEPGGNNNFVITGFTIDGAGATISYATIETLTVNGIGGTNTFTVNGDSIPTYINGASGSDTFTINSSSAPLYLDGGAGDDTFTINGNSGPLVVTGDAGNDTFTINGNSGSATLSGGDDNDTFIINGSSGGSVLSANGDAGNDTFTINALSSPATLNGGADNDTFTVNAPLAAHTNDHRRRRN